MVVIFVRNSAICGIFFPVLILRNFKSSLYPKKYCYEGTRMMLALKRIILCIKIVFKRVKLQFTWQKKIECGFCRNKNDNHELKWTVVNSVSCNFLVIVRESYQCITVILMLIQNCITKKQLVNVTSCFWSFQLVILVLWWSYHANIWYSHSFGITNHAAIFDVDVHHIHVTFCG